MGLLSEIKETLSTSSIHALPNIVQNKFKSIKLVWAVFFLISSAACAYFITITLTEYLQFDVVTKSTIKYVSKIDLPIISICDTNAFSTEHADHFIKNKFYLNFSDFDFTKSQSEIKYDYLAKRFKILLDAKNYSNQKEFGKKLDYILISCLFNSDVCNFVEDFENYYDIYYGSCYRYNFGTLKKQITTNGILNGLQLELFVGKIDDNYNLLSIENGINLFIENEIKDSQIGEGIRIAPGTKTFISLTKHSKSHLPKPYSDCTDGLDRPESSDNIFFRNLIANNQTYRKSLCRFNCFQRYLGDKCKCQDLFTVSFYENLPFCYIEAEMFDCQINAFKNFSQSGLFGDCDCPVRCSSSYFTYELSNSEYPTKFYARFLSQNKNLTKKYNFSDEFNYEDYKKSLASINIFYNELKEMIYEQNPKITDVELISNIGGTLGYVRTKELINYWLFNSHIQDIIGGAHFYNGTSAGLTSDRFERPLSALNLKNGFYQIPPNNYFPSGQFTISVWIYLRAYGDWSKIVSFFNEGVLDSITIGFQGSSSIIQFAITNQNQLIAVIISSTPLKLNEWTHLAINFEQSLNFKIYINGVLNATSIWNPPQALKNVTRLYNYIGRGDYSMQPDLNAKIDELKIFDRASTQQEIQFEMNNDIY